MELKQFLQYLAERNAGAGGPFYVAVVAFFEAMLASKDPLAEADCLIRTVLNNLRTTTEDKNVSLSPEEAKRLGELIERYW